MTARELHDLVQSSGLPVPPGWGYSYALDEWRNNHAPNGFRTPDEAAAIILSHAIEVANKQGWLVHFVPHKDSGGVLVQLQHCDDGKCERAIVGRLDTAGIHITALAACWARAFPKEPHND